MILLARSAALFLAFWFHRSGKMENKFFLHHLLEEIRRRNSSRLRKCSSPCNKFHHPQITLTTVTSTLTSWPVVFSTRQVAPPCITFSKQTFSSFFLGGGQHNNNISTQQQSNNDKSENASSTTSPPNVQPQHRTFLVASAYGISKTANRSIFESSLIYRSNNYLTMEPPLLSPTSSQASSPSSSSTSTTVSSSKDSICGEDGYFIANVKEGEFESRAAGVADGVGGWANVRSGCCLIIFLGTIWMQRSDK